MTRCQRRVLSYLLALAVLLGVFSLYTRPDVVVDIANQLWSCF